MSTARDKGGETTGDERGEPGEVGKGKEHQGGSRTRYGSMPKRTGGRTRDRGSVGGKMIGGRGSGTKGEGEVVGAKAEGKG